MQQGLREVAERVLGGIRARDRLSVGADRGSQTSNLTLKLPGLDFPVPVGAYVHVDYQVSRPSVDGVCGVRIAITNLPSLNSITNPIDTTSHLWLAISDYAVTHDAIPLGVSVTTVAQGCQVKAEGACGELPPDDYHLRLSLGDDSTEVLIQVNVAGEEGKGGVDPAALGAAIDACPVRVVGLSTMPPFSVDPEASRPYFARLAELAGEHGLSRLSMGTTQDWRVAVDEGATTIRIGSILFG